MKSLRILLLLTLIGFYSCENEVENKKIQSFSSLKGLWTYLEKGEEKKEDFYKEIEFFKGDSVIIHTLANASFGPFKYYVKGDSLKFQQLSFILNKTEFGFKLENELSSFDLYKIPSGENKLSKDQIDPMFLRRNYFMVQLGYINMDESLQFLNSIETITINDTIDFEEEIPNKTKHNNGYN